MLEKNQFSEDNSSLLVPISGIEGQQNPYGFTLDSPLIAASLLNPVGEELNYQPNFEAQTVNFANKFQVINSINYGKNSELNTVFGLNQDVEGDSLLSGGSKEIAFVDGGLSNYEGLITGFDRALQVVVLDSRKNELDQISEFLGNQVQNYSAIHVFTHGMTGQLLFGNTVLNNQELNNYQGYLSTLGNALQPGGDLLLYGCDIAEGEAGKNFVQELGKITGADVAASTNLTGNWALGGDWNLEYATGKIETQSLSNSYYQSVLDSVSIDSSGKLVFTGSTDGDTNVTFKLSSDKQFVLVHWDERQYAPGTAHTSADITNSATKDASFLLANITNGVSIDVGVISTSQVLNPGQDTVTIESLYTNGGDLNINGGPASSIDIKGIVSTRKVAAGGDPETAASIGNSGKISFDARTINVGVTETTNNITTTFAGKLLTNVIGPNPNNYLAGDIKLNVDETWGTTLFGANFGNIAKLNLTSATIKGGNVNFDAYTSFSPKDGNTGETIVNALDNLALFGGVAIAPVTSEINVDANSSISAANFTAKAQADGSASISTMSAGINVRVSYGKVDSDARINFAGQLFTTGNADIQAITKNKLDVAADTTAVDPGQRFALGVAVSQLYSDAIAQFTDTSVLNIGGNLNLQSTTIDRNSTYARAATGPDGAVAIGVAVSFEESNTNAFLDSKNANVTGNINVNASSRKGEPISSLSGDKSGVVAYGSTNATTTGDTVSDGIDTLVLKAISGVMALKAKRDAANRAKYNMPEPPPEKPSKLSQLLAPVNKALDKLDFVGSVAYHQDTNNATARIGDNAIVTSSNGAIDVQAEVRNRPDISATSLIGKFEPTAQNSTPPKVGIAAALPIGIYNNNATAFLGANSTVNARKSLDVTAQTINEYEFQYGVNIYNAFTQKTDDLGKQLTFGQKAKNVLSSFTGYLNDNAGLDKYVFDSWSQSTAGGGASNFGGAASVTYISINHNSQAYIGDNAKINQNTSLRSDQQTVNVEAFSVNESVNFSGNIQLPGVTGDATGTIKWADKKKFFKPSLGGGGTDNQNSAGASVFVIQYDNDVSAKIGQGVILYADSLKVNAQTKVLSVDVVASGGESKNVGLNGAFGWTEINNNTIAQINSGAMLTIGNNIISGTNKSLLVNAQDDMGIFSIIGGAAVSNSIGAGVSAGVNIVNRNTAAFIGSSADQQPGLGTNITVDGDAEVKANSDGGIWAFSLAAAVVTQAAPEPPSTPPAPPSDPISEDFDTGDQINLIKPSATSSEVPMEKVSPDSTSTSTQTSSAQGDTSDSQGKGKQGQSGFALAGDVAVNWVEDNVRAYINTTGIIKTKQLNLTALNDTDLISAGGAAAFVTPTDQGTSAGIAGAFSYNKLSGATEAFISGKSSTVPQTLSLTTIGLTLDAKRSGLLIAVTAGGAGAASADGYAIAGSVSINSISNNTSSYITGINGSTGSASLNANDSSSMWVVAGAAAFGGKAGLGAAVAVNQISNNTSSYIQNSWLTHSQTLSLSSSNDSNIQALSAAVGVSKDTLGASGTVSVNRISNNTTANLFNFNNGTTSTGAIALSAKDDSAIYSLSGAVGIGENTGIGAAAAYNAITNNVSAYIQSSNITTTDGLTLTANSAADIQTLSAGVGISQKDFAFAGSLSINEIDNSATTYIKDSKQNTANPSQSQGVKTGKNIQLKASDDSTIKNLSGGAAVSTSGSAAGAGVSINAIGDNTDNTKGVKAYIDNADVSSSGSVTLEADNNATIGAIALGVAGGEKYALGGSVAVNKIQSQADAHISNNATVTSVNAISISANDDSTIETVAGAAGISLSKSAVGAAISINNIDNRTQAYIDLSQVNSSANNVTVNASETATIKALTLAGAGAEGFALGGSISINRIGNHTSAEIRNQSIVNAGGLITVSSADNSTIQALAGAVGASFSSSAVGASIAFNKIDNRTTANINNAQIKGSDLNLFSNQAATIEAISAAGSAGAKTAISGAINLSFINTVTSASINNNSNVTTTGLVAIAADDNSVIKSLGGQFAIGGTNGVGASISTSFVNNNVEAYISNSTANSNNLTISATSAPTVQNITAGASGAGTFALGGAVSVNYINTQTLAYISNSSTINTLQNVNILASNDADIQSLAGQVSGAGSAAIGAALAVNNSGGTTAAYITNSSVTSGGAVKVAATGTSTIESLTAGASVAGEVALTGSVSVNNITDTIEAYVSGSAIATNTLEISAKNDATIKSLAGQFSGAGTVAVGASVAYNNIGNTVQAYSLNSQINAQGNVLINADGNGDIETIAVGGSIGGLVGIAGSDAINQMNNNVSAYIQGGTLFTPGTVGVLANSVNSMKTYGGALSGGLAAGVGATIVVNNLNNSTKAYLQNANVTALGNNTLTVPLADGTGNSQAMNGLAVIATSDENLEVVIATASLGIGALAGSIAVNSFKDTTEASINGGTINGTNTGANSNQSLFVKAFNDSTVNIKAGAGAAGGVGIGASIDVTTVKNGTSAFINNANVNIAKDLTVTAITQKDVNSLVVAAAVGAIGVSGAVSVVNVSAAMTGDSVTAAGDTQSNVSKELGNLNNMGKSASGQSNIQTKSDITSDLSSTPVNIKGTTAFIAGNINVGGNIQVIADETSDFGITAGAGAGGLLGVGGAVGIGTITHNTSAYIGANANIAAGGNIQITAVGLVDSSHIKSYAGAAGLVGLGAAVSDLTSNNNTSAYIDAGAKITQANNIDLQAGSSSSVSVEGWGAAVGAAAVGIVIADAKESGTTKAYIGNGVQIQNANNVNVNATVKEAVSAVAQAAAGGIIAGNGAIPTANVAPTVKAYIGDNANIQATNDVKIVSDVTVDGDAEAKGVSVGLIAVGASIAEVNSNPNVDTHIGAFSTIDATNVTVQSRLGAPIATGDTSFDPSLAVNNSQDKITFSSPHGLQTGDRVVYMNGGGTDIAGLSNQSSYNVIAVDSQTVQLGSTFNAADIDVKFNTIKFAQNHGFQDGDKVVYEATGGSAIGGLVSGQTYYVKVVDSKTLKLNTSPTVVNFTYLTDNLSNQVTVVKHGLNTGDRVVYKAMGQNALGGLTTGNYYYVIRDDIDHFRLASSLNNAQIGSAINLTENSEQHQLAPATTQGTDLANINTTTPDTVITINDHGFKNNDQLNYQQRIAKFTVVKTLPDTQGKANIFNLGNDIINNDVINSAAHGFETDDQVIYNATTTALGGLVKGQTYYVIKVDADHFKLSATKTGTAIDLTSANQDTEHQIKAVALKIQQVNQYNFSYGTDNPLNQITLNNHGFTNNQAVVYKTNGTALGGLIAGNTYYVNVIDVNNFQLTSTVGGTFIDLGAGSGTHQLIVNLGLQNLEEGVPYYVVGATQNTFKLATTLGGTAVTLDKASLTGTGLDHLFNKETVIDLTTAGTGTQNLHIDLDNSTATGTSHLLSSGATATIPSQGDNKFSAYSQAAAGALIGGTATEATLNLTSNMTTYLGNNATITAKGNVTVDSLSSVQVTGSTTSGVFGAIAVGGSQINVNLTNNNTTYIGDLSVIKADGNVLINGETAQTISVSGEGGAGSLITFADAEAHIDLTYNNTTYIGSFAEIIAKNDLTVDSNSNTDGKAKAGAYGIGLYADADAESTFNVNGSNLTDIRQNAYLEGRTVNLQSLVDKLNVEARSESEGAGLIGNIDAHAHVNLSGTDNNLLIGSEAYIKGDYINLDAIFKNVTSNAIALSDCDGLGGDTDSNTSNNMPLTAKIWTDSASILEVYKLNVTSDFTNFNKTTRSSSDLAWSITIWTPFGDITITLDFGTEWEKETFAPTPIIDFNSNVKLLSREANPLLVVDSNGNIIQKSDNVTATITGADVIVGDIDNTGVGSVTFNIPSRSSEMSSNGIFIDNGKYTVIDPAYDTVDITNYSNLNLIINDISVINPGGTPPITYNVYVSNKTIAPNGPTLGALPVNPTIVTINNWGNSDIILQGVIDNPHDRTFIYSTDNIFVNGNLQNIITRDLTMTAVNGSIGTNTQSINAQLNQGYSPVTPEVPSHKIYLEAIAKGSVFLNLTAKQLDTLPVTVNVEKMTATTGEVNININQTTNSSGSNVMALYDFIKEYNLDDTEKADSNIIAGTNITINAGTTTTNINGRTDFLGNGLLDVQTGGYINLTELNGGVNLYRAISDQDYITLTITESANSGENLLLVDNAVVKAAKDVTFLVGDNFEITPTATITSTGGNVIIKGDYGNKDTAGTLVNIYGWIYAQAMSIYGESNQDTFNIRRLATRTNLWAGGDDDIINVGSNQPLFIGTLDEIIKSLTIYGEGQNNRDIINVDDGGDTSNNTGILTNKSLTGLDMGEGIFYSGLELFNLTLGLGNDNLTVLNTGANTNISDRGGDNNFRFGPKLDSLGNVLAETMDGVLTQGQNILGTSHLTNLITSTGKDFIQVNRNTAVLNIQSGLGDDTLEVNTPILNSTLLSNAQVNFAGEGGNDTAIANGSSVSEIITTNGLNVTVTNSRTISLATSETLNINSNTGNDTVNIDTVAGSNVTTLNVNGNAGSDVINLYSLLSTITTNLNGDSENDIFNLGSQGTSSPTLNKILGQVTMTGGNGTDTVNFKDDQDNTNNTGTLTNTTLTGLGLGKVLTYNTLETLNLNLGIGNDTLTVQSTHTGVTNIKANSGNDQVNIQANSGDTFVWLGAGNDTVNVGSTQPVAGGKLDKITKKLTVYGETHTTGDTLNIDNSGDTTNRTAILTKDSITGLGMGVGISYNTIETMNINLGSGADTFTSLDTGAVTNLNTGDGNDQVRMGPNLDADGIPLAEVNPALAANLINGNSFAMTVNTGKGDDNITVNRNVAALTLQGGDGNDNIQLNTATDRQTGLLVNGAVTLDGGNGTDAIALNGSFRAETMQINAQGVKVTGSRTTTFSKLENLTVNGNAGSDNITVNASVTTTGTPTTTTSLTQIQVNGGLDNDTLNVSSVLASTNVTVAGNEGNDTIKLGNATNTLNQIAGGVTIDGSTGTDTMLVNNQGTTTNQTGNITATTITGFGLGTKGITYNNTEDLQINLGSGADTVTVNGTHQSKTTINTNGGNDTVTVNSIGGQTIVNVGAGNDNFSTKVALSAAGLAFSDPENKTPTMISSSGTPILPTSTSTTTTPTTTNTGTTTTGTTTTTTKSTQPGITSTNISSPTNITTGTTTTTKTVTTTTPTTSSTKTTIKPPTQPGISSTTITSPTTTTNTTTTQTGIISSLISKITGIFSK